MDYFTIFFVLILKYEVCIISRARWPHGTVAPTEESADVESRVWLTCSKRETGKLSYWPSTQCRGLLGGHEEREDTDEDRIKKPKKPSSSLAWGDRWKEWLKAAPCIRPRGQEGYRGMTDWRMERLSNHVTQPRVTKDAAIQKEVTRRHTSGTWPQLQVSWLSDWYFCTLLCLEAEFSLSPVAVLREIGASGQ